MHSNFLADFPYVVAFIQCIRGGFWFIDFMNGEDGDSSFSLHFCMMLSMMLKFADLEHDAGLCRF